MINIRYHIVSIVAIFLALALGVAVGSAFIDDATIATLENRLDALQDEIDETTEDNEALEAQVARLEQVRESLGAEAGERLLSGRIEEQPLLVITVEGTEADTLRAVRGAIEDSGAALAGTLTVTAAAQPPDGEDLVPLAGLVDSSAAGAEVWNDVWRELVSAAAISATTGEDPAPTTTSTVPTTTTSAPSTTTTAPTGEPGDGPTSTTASTTTTTRPTTTTTTPADLQDERAAGIVELVEDGVDLGVWTFEDTLAIDLADAFAAGAAPRFVVVSDAAWVDEASAALAGDVLVPLLEELADVDEMALAVVAETSPAAYPVIEVDEAEGGEEDGGGEEAEGGPEGRSLAITVRTTPEMAERVSTVDDVDRFAGAVALVLALEDLPDRVGAYGVRPSATALVPPP